MKNKKQVNKLRVNWPAIIAIAVALGIISYCNEKRVEEYNKQQVHLNVTKFEEAFEATKNQITQHELLPIYGTEEYSEVEKQNGRSK